MRKSFIRAIVVLLCVMQLVQMLSGTLCTYADNSESVSGLKDNTFAANNDSYTAYMEKVKNLPLAKENLKIASNTKQGGTADFATEEMFGEKDCIIFDSIGDTATFTFDVAQSGLYELCFNYAAIQSKTMDIQIKVLIDGNFLWEDTSSLKLLRWWKNSKDEWQIDRDGNEVTSEQVEVFGFRKQYVFDDIGLEKENYRFALEAGTHTVEIISVQEPFALKEIIFAAPIVCENYKNIEKGYKDYEDYSGTPIVIQGENALEKSAHSLTAKSDSLSAAVQPQTPYKNVINYIGGSTWSVAGQSIKWELNIPKDGLYEIGFHFKQSGIVNGSVYRELKIDGIAPFAEAREIEFLYDSSWQYQYLADKSGKPCKVYLTKGKHELELSAVLGPMADYFMSLRKIVETIGDEYLKINMITGEVPDPNRDYDLFKQIPTLESSFKECVSSLTELGKAMKKDEKNSSQYITTINGTTRILNQMMKTKYLAHTYKSDLYTQYCNLSSLLYEMLGMPLSIDEIRIMAPGSKEPEYSTFWSELKYTVLSFITTFTEDYSSKNTGNSETTIKLWTTWGRDQTQILNSLIAESFTPEYGIDVNVQITGATLIQGMLTNNAPDLAIGIERTRPVNYALRGAVYDLSKFDDFNEVLTRFNKGAEEPYKYKGGCYALPDTQSFNIMFYRKDILASLDIGVPETWDDFKEATATIQRNNMNVFVPDIYSTLLMQHDIPMYNKERTRNLLDNDEAIKVFEMWTDFYTEYKVPVTADFYNRFRVGVTPLGITAYTTYTTFSQTAPDIEGRWGIAMIPGVEDKDGNISNTVAGGGTGCVILNDSKNKEAAWKFLKWWTSEDVQYRYSKGVESLLGATGRVATSNKKAFSNYAWNSGDLEILLDQWQHVEELPEVPGSYYMTRSIEQAYLAVVNGVSTPSDALVKWSAVANDEIDRKIKEYS